MNADELVGKRVRLGRDGLATVVSVKLDDRAGRRGPATCVIRYDDFPGTVLASAIEKLPDERGSKL